jgi:hypothetical protein
MDVDILAKLFCGPMVTFIGLWFLVEMPIPGKPMGKHNLGYFLHGPPVWFSIIFGGVLTLVGLYLIISGIKNVIDMKHDKDK